MRDSDVHKEALRANGLSVDSLKMPAAVIGQDRRFEGLTADDPAQDLGLDD
ncbi:MULTISPECIES: hypothetical protein [unclassified Streptomyces]|uniref:hypothetical protein n=1 Tax=unclassified Streptomyces TaxID=2593676 RepID=UPI00381E9C4D